MLTVGLVRELGFVSGIAGLPVSLSLSLADIVTVKVCIFNKILELYSEEELIWRESLDEEIGNFGVESCQRIAEIINKKYRNEDYKHLIYKENP